METVDTLLKKKRKPTKKRKSIFEKFIDLLFGAGIGLFAMLVGSYFIYPGLFVTLIICFLIYTILLMIFMFISFYNNLVVTIETP